MINSGAMVFRTRQIACLLAATALLGACTGSGDKYPSLAVRDAERITGTFAPAPTPEQEPVAPVADRATLVEIVKMAQSAYEQFVEAAPGTLRTVRAAKGMGPESNQWSRAQVALADLETYRSTTMIALADLDTLAAQAGVTFAPEDDLKAAQSQVAGWLAEQDELLDNLISETGA